MPLIVDANVAHQFDPPPGHVAAAVLDAVRRGQIYLVSGGLNKDELMGCGFRRIYLALQAAGRLREYAHDTIEALYPADGTIVSDDPHVIALARASNARVLYSLDQNLQADFTNSAVLQPKGRVYKYFPDHRHLLRD